MSQENSESVYTCIIYKQYYKLPIELLSYIKSPSVATKYIQKRRIALSFLNSYENSTNIMKNIYWLE